MAGAKSSMLRKPCYHPSSLQDTVCSSLLGKQPQEGKGGTDGPKVRKRRHRWPVLSGQRSEFKVNMRRTGGGNS